MLGAADGEEVLLLDQGFAGAEALDQSTPEYCVVDEFVVDDRADMLLLIVFMLCGAEGWITGKFELREWNVLSGVIVLELPWGAVRLEGGDTGGGVDQENVAAGEAFCEVRARFIGFCDGNVEDAADVGAVQGSPPSMSVPDVWLLPRTRASKSDSPLVASVPFVPPIEPKVMNSLRVVI